MSSGRYIEGNCKICGSYTKSIEYEHRGLCLACANKLDYHSEEFTIEVNQDCNELLSKFNNLKYELEEYEEIVKGQKNLTKNELQKFVNDMESLEKRIRELTNEVLRHYSKFDKIR